MLQSTVQNSIMHQPYHHPQNNLSPYNHTYNNFLQELNNNNRKMNLLDQYAQCLQKQNKAKSTQIQVLHERLNSIQRDNQQLRQYIRQIKYLQSNKCMNRTAENSFNKSEIKLETKEYSMQTQVQQKQQCYQQLNQELEEYHYLLQQKNRQINRYQKQGQEMFIAIQQLQKKIVQLRQNSAKDQQTIESLENTLMNKQQKIQYLYQQTINKVQESTKTQEDKENGHNFQIQQRLSDLISQNNALIQKNRLLERQKNQYYNEVKRYSRPSIGKQNLSKSNLKPSRIKDKRFREIQQNLRKIKQQNKLLQANLQID